MSKKWEVRKVSTSECIFDKINNEMAQPVGIVLFGADCDLKDDVKKEVIEALGLQGGAGGCGLDGEADYEYGQCYLKTEHHLRYRFSVGQKFAMVILDSHSSSEHDFRHGFVDAIRNAGAKTVVGIYAKADKKPIRPLMSNVEDVEFNKRITAIEQSNPTADGLDYLLITSEETEE